MTDSAIVCKEVFKHYGEGASRVDALRGINLEIKRGELSLLMGPSGSGKTTLISIMAGILTQDSGTCLVDDIDLNRFPDQERTRFRGKNIGFVFQIFNLIPMLTCAENVSIPLLLNGVEKKEALERSRLLLGEMGLADKVDVFPPQLSGGQQQRVAIARGLVHDPQLIVCDEPTSFLDHITGSKIMELLKSMVAKKGLTIIVVTHDPRIMPFADNVHELEDGKIVKEK